MKYLAYIEVNTRDINGDRADAQRKGDKVKQKGAERKRGRPRGSKPSGQEHWEGQVWTPHKHAYDKGVMKGGERDALGHVIWRTGAWAWCHRCGLHSRNKVVGLRSSAITPSPTPKRAGDETAYVEEGTLMEARRLVSTPTLWGA